MKEFWHLRIINFYLYFSILTICLENNLNPEVGVDTKPEPSMHRNSGPPSDQFDPNTFNPAFPTHLIESEQALEEESRDTVLVNDTFSGNEKEAKKNRERFAITKSYSIEVI